MSVLTDRPRQPGLDGRAPWKHPTVSLVGTISLVVRGGSAMGKTTGNQDGDTGNFQCFPTSCQ